MEEYGLDFRFLLQELLVENPKQGTRVRAPSRSQTRLLTDPIITPASGSTLRARSPGPQAESGPFLTVPSGRSRSPLPGSDDKLSSPLETSPITPLPSAALPSPYMPTLPTSIGNALSPIPITPVSNNSRTYRASPVPMSAVPARTLTSANVKSNPSLRAAAAAGGLPPRSGDRPASATGHRPPPVAVPRRDGMI